MAPAASRSPLRILLACARPLVLKKERWAAELTETAAPHRGPAETALRELVDVAGVVAVGRTLWFELYPPRPDPDTLHGWLNKVVPLAQLRLVDQQDIPQDVLRPGEELVAIMEGIDRLPGVEISVHPAATPAAIRDFLRDNDVDVLQLALHGDIHGGLYFEDGRGPARRLMPTELADLLGGKVKLLNAGACYSADAVAALFPGGADGALIPAAVSIDGEYPIPSRAVQLFSRAFFASLTRGCDVATSFSGGLEAVRTDDLVGERAIPDGADGDMPSPWNRFRRHGDDVLAWSPDGQVEAKIQFLVTPTRTGNCPAPTSCS